jgi:hypothetical protein
MGVYTFFSFGQQQCFAFGKTILDFILIPTNGLTNICSLPAYYHGLVGLSENL